MTIAAGRERAIAAARERVHNKVNTLPCPVHCATQQEESEELNAVYQPGLEPHVRTRSTISPSRGPTGNTVSLPRTMCACGGRTISFTFQRQIFLRFAVLKNKQTVLLLNISKNLRRAVPDAFSLHGNLLSNLVANHYFPYRSRGTRAA